MSISSIEGYKSVKPPISDLGPENWQKFDPVQF